MRRLIYRSIILVAALASLTAAGWFSRKGYQKNQEHRFLENAADALQLNDLGTAALCLRQALQLNPKSIEAITTMADLLEREGAPSAVEWRIRAARLQPGDTTARLDWAETAIKTGALGSAEEALAGIAESARDTASYHKLAGALAWRLSRKAEAEMHYLEAARLESTNELSAFNLETIRLSSTNRAVAEAARLCIEQQQATNSSLRLTALRQLLAYEKINRAWPKALEYSQEIVTNTAANDDDKLNHLELLRQTADPQFDSWLSELKLSVTNSPARAFALGKRLQKLESPSHVLAWVQNLPEEVQSSPPVPQVAADCYVALKDWPGLLEAIESQNWADGEASRLALIALARRSLGQDAAAQSAWDEALEEAAHRLDGLSSLARLAAAWGWEPERKEVLAQMARQFPNEQLR